MDEKTKQRIIAKWEDATDMFVILMDRKPSISGNVGDRILFLKILGMLENKPKEEEEQEER